MTRNLMVLPETQTPQQFEKDESAASVPQVTHRVHSSQWWQVADVSVFLSWLAIVGLIVQHHEPWADESQAWLIARDLDLRTIWFHEARYEGSPALWHTILWIAQHLFHAPYVSLGIIGMACAALGVAFTLWKAPFPRPFRYLLVFSYVLVYQYAVVSRSYNLLPLLVFASAHLFRDRAHPVRMTVVLILLANVAVHGAVLAACLAFCYSIAAIKEWPVFEVTVRRRYIVCAGAMLLVFGFLFVILRPAPDVLEFVANKNPARFHRGTLPISVKLDQVVSGAFLENAWLSSIFLVLAAAWCFWRKSLLVFVVPVGALIVLYVEIHGRSHHHGTIFLAAMAAIWIAWPNHLQWKALSRRDLWATQGMALLLAVLFASNTYDAAIAMRNDYRYPYSGSQDAAIYLKSVGADKASIFGYTYGMSAIQAYFNHNILTNMPATYFHEGLPLYGFDVNIDELQREAPEYVIIFSNVTRRDFNFINPPLNSIGYHLVHFSDGNVFYKRGAIDSASYFIYRRDAY